MLIGDTSKFELEFGCVGFLGEGKTGAPGEKPLGARTRTNNKLNNASSIKHLGGLLYNILSFSNILSSSFAIYYKFEPS